MKTENHFFESLDACFIGIDQTSNDPLLWKCAGMQIQQRFELPIPSLAGSVCKYSFSTTIGDIAFSVEYRCKGRPDEKIFGNSRVPSDLEPISGTFKSVREGTLLFIFDNSFSWYNPKILTYKIELFQVRDVHTLWSSYLPIMERMRHHKRFYQDWSRFLIYCSQLFKLLIIWDAWRAGTC